MYNNKKLKQIAILAISVLLIVIGISIYFIIDDMQKTATLEIVVAPISANIKVNDHTYANMQSHRVKPGDYHISITKPDYFESYEENFTLNDGEKKEIYIELTQLPGTDWYKDHPKDAYSMDAIINHELAKNSEYLIKNYPLLKVLPLKVEYFINNSTYVYYVISYEINEDNKPTILIKDYTGGNHDAAIQRIQSEGYNPEDYQIEYQDKTSEIAPAFSPE